MLRVTRSIAQTTEEPSLGVPSRVPLRASPSDAGLRTFHGGHGAAAHTAAQMALWVPQWGGTGTQVLLTSERGSRTQGPRPAHPGRRGMFRNAVQAWQEQPSDTTEGPDPTTTCAGTQGHRLPSEEEQGPLPHPSAHRSSAQSKPMESRARGCLRSPGSGCMRAQSHKHTSNNRDTA